MDNNYYWLLLKNGELAVGVKADRPVSFAVLHPDGTMGTASDSDVFDKKPIVRPRVLMTSENVLIGQIAR